jgi:tetratricopeptide (TPR) repeat protein
MEKLSPWEGKNTIQQKTLFLLGTTDITNTLALAPYALVLSRLGANIIAEAPAPLIELLNNSMPIEWLAPNQSIKTTDFVQSLAELPKIIGLDNSMAPFPNGFLKPNEEKKEKWRRHWQQNQRFCLGLSCQPDELHTILPMIPGSFHLVILGTQFSKNEIEDIKQSHTVDDLSELNKNYEELAAAMSWLDAVITTSSEIYALSTGLGISVFSYTQGLESSLNTFLNQRGFLSTINDLGINTLIFKTKKYQDHFDYLNHCIVKLMNEKKYHHALNLINHIVKNEENPKYIYNCCLAYSTLARLYNRKDMIDKAIQLGEIAINILSHEKKMYLNLGKSYTDMNMLSRSKAVYLKAISYDPEYALARVNYAIILLLEADYKNGFNYYQYRWKMEAFKTREKFEYYSRYQWLSSKHLKEINNKVILVVDEQGIGDSLMLVRLIESLKKMGANIIFATRQILFRLYQRLNYIDQLIGRNAELPNADFMCFLFDLPYLLNLNIKTIPQQTPYLSVNKDDIVCQNFNIISDKKIGLCWRGNQKHPNDFLRLIPLETLLTGLPSKHKYVSLQIETHPLEFNLMKENNIIDLPVKINDFYDTACFIENLDLIITIDSSIVHMAGALNKPTILLLPFSPDWRWQLERTDTPWYPSVTIIRQREWGNWYDVMVELKAILNKI